MIRFLVGLLFSVTVANSFVLAGDDYVLSAAHTGGVVFPGSVTSMEFSVTNTTSNGIAGWSFGACHPPTLSLVDVEEHPSLGVPGPDVCVTQVYGNGFTVGCVISFLGSPTLGTGTHPIHLAEYLVLDSGCSEVSFCSSLGAPPVQIVVVVDGATYVPAIVEDSICTPASMLRGDANGDSIFDVADSIFTLQVLFQQEGSFSCATAGDVNDDGQVNLADAVFGVQYFFADGAPPAEPFPGCDSDPSPDGLDCSTPGCS